MKVSFLNLINSIYEKPTADTTLSDQRLKAFTFKEENLTCMYVQYVQSFSHVQLSATSWTVAIQAPLSMKFSRQEYRSGLPFPPPGDPPCPGIKCESLKSPALAGKFFVLVPPGKS